MPKQLSFAFQPPKCPEKPNSGSSRWSHGVLAPRGTGIQHQMVVAEQHKDLPPPPPTLEIPTVCQFNIARGAATKIAPTGFGTPQHPTGLVPALGT